MNSTPYLHLAWKEYRAVRLFWLAIVGLTIVGDLVATSLASSPDLRTTWIFNLAFVPPVLFALGSAAAAFSGEQEEGTFEFLRIAPISSQQVLASKLAVAALGTEAMFVVLWPVAQWFNHSQLPGDVQLHNMLGLWLVAALEAIAWGTLFSLVTARPMLAVILAMTAASSAAHFFAWRTRLTQNFGFEFASYLRAVPWRIVAALVVLGVDIALGRHWLEGTGNATKGLRTWSRRKIRIGAEETEASRALAGSIVFQPDRGQMLGHLLWQHWRQSKWVMIILVGSQIALFEMIGGLVGGLLGDRLRQSDLAAIGPLAAFAALMGACVFLSDQERRHFRFFIEHNVPARYVWLTRQLPWMATLFVATIFTIWRLLKHSDFEQLWHLIVSLTDPSQNGRRANQFGNFLYLGYHFPPFAVYLSCVVVSYCAGQWASMMIRSGIMAGFVGLLLSGLLCGWVFLMQLLDLSWLWTIAPIPLVLLWATWLRAPDWVRENTTWSARRRAALAVVVPAAVICTMIGYYRVEQIHWKSPGFDVAAFEVETTRGDAFATGELYRRAASAFVYPKEDLEIDRPITDAQREHLKQNAESLALELEASKRSDCAFAQPGTFSLTPLIDLSGHELEADGKLKEALDRYISSLYVALHFAGRESTTYTKSTFQQIADWAALKGQTPERLRLAIQKLESLKDADPSFERAIKNQYIQERRWAEGEKSDDFFPRTNQSLATAATVDMIMPWERSRAVRALNVVTADVLNQIQQIQSFLNMQEQSNHAPNFAAIRMLPPTNGPDSWWWVSPGDVGLFESTFPSPEPMSNFGSAIARDLVEFEALRRGTMIVLALQAYRLEHGKLPDSLDQLADISPNSGNAANLPLPIHAQPANGAFFQFVPLDPYSGEPFRYFPRGLPELPKQPDVLSADPDWASGIDNTLSNIAEAWKQKSIVAGVPGIWSTGPDLIGKWVDEQMYDPETMESVKSTPHLYYWSRWPGGEQSSLPNYAAWPKGIWFPIPEWKEMKEGKDR
jgi:ABC-2 family transporter protein